MEITSKYNQNKNYYIHSRGNINNRLRFTFGENEIEIIKDYKYLGIHFNQSRSFAQAKKHIAEQAGKAVFALLKNIKRLSLPYDLQIDLFNKTIKPILFFGCEIRGTGNNEILERVQLNYIKQIFGLRKSTPSYMIYVELGIMPLNIDIQTKIISFWSRLIETVNPNKFSVAMYTIIFELSNRNRINVKWINNIKEILCSLGFSAVRASQSFLNKTWLVKSINSKL